jgi:hypothetical protein
MKFAKHLVALAVVGAAFSAQAASDINIGAGANLTANANLNFRITVPRLIFLAVGTSTLFADLATTDRVDFTLTAAQIAAPGTAVAGVSTGGAINTRVFGNGGAINFSANGSLNGLSPLVAGPALVPWTQIAATSVSGTLLPPAIGNGVAGANSPLAATGGVVNQTGVWSFNYLNTSAIAAGEYNGTVVYTAVMP